MTHESYQSRVNVLDNNLRPAKATTFRFAVGTTF